MAKRIVQENFHPVLVEGSAAKAADARPAHRESRVAAAGLEPEAGRFLSGDDGVVTFEGSADDGAWRPDGAWRLSSAGDWTTERAPCDNIDGVIDRALRLTDSVLENSPEFAGEAFSNLRRLGETLQTYMPSHPALARLHAYFATCDRRKAQKRLH